MKRTTDTNSGTSRGGISVDLSNMGILAGHVFSERETPGIKIHMLFGSPVVT